MAVIKSIFEFSTNILEVATKPVIIGFIGKKDTTWMVLVSRSIRTYFSIECVVCHEKLTCFKCHLPYVNIHKTLCCYGWIFIDVKYIHFKGLPVIFGMELIHQIRKLALFGKRFGMFDCTDVGT